MPSCRPRGGPLPLGAAADRYADLPLTTESANAGPTPVGPATPSLMELATHAQDVEIGAVALPREAGSMLCAHSPARAAA